MSKPTTTPEWQLIWCVAAGRAKSTAALTNLKALCETPSGGALQHGGDRPAEDPEARRREQIMAVPTLVRKLPHPIRKIIGDLSP